MSYFRVIGVVVCIVLLTENRHVAGGTYHLCSHQWSTKRFQATVAGTNVLAIDSIGDDSRTDLLLQEPTKILKTKAQQDGLFLNKNTEIVDDNPFCIGSNDKLFVADVNGDSRDDLVCWKGSDGSLWARSKHGRTYTPEAEVHGFKCLAPANSLVIGDFDGNGADDYFCHDNGAFMLNGARMYLNIICRHELYQWTNSYRPHRHPVICKPAEPVVHILPAGTQLQCSPLMGDRLIAAQLNADGKDDLICIGGTSGSLSTYRSEVTESTVAFRPYSPSGGNVQCILSSGAVVLPIDMDGDGRDVFLCLAGDAQSLGSGTTVATLVELDVGSVDLESPAFPDCTPGFCEGSALPGTTRYAVGDFNGDGKEDLLCRFDTAAGATETHVVYSERNI